MTTPHWGTAATSWLGLNDNVIGQREVTWLGLKNITYIATIPLLDAVFGTSEQLRLLILLI